MTNLSISSGFQKSLSRSSLTLKRDSVRKKSELWRGRKSGLKRIEKPWTHAKESSTPPKRHSGSNKCTQDLKMLWQQIKTDSHLIVPISQGQFKKAYQCLTRVRFKSSILTKHQPLKIPSLSITSLHLLCKLLTSLKVGSLAQNWALSKRTQWRHHIILSHAATVMASFCLGVDFSCTSRSSRQRKASPSTSRMSSFLKSSVRKNLLSSSKVLKTLLLPSKRRLKLRKNLMTEPKSCWD